jgi:hypothetical protein
MGRLGAIKKKKNPQATELSQLKEELRRVAEKFEPHKGKFSEALEQHVHDLKPEVEIELSESKTLQAISDVCALAFATAASDDTELVIRFGKRMNGTK